MSVQEVLDVIKAFFDAILKIFESIGFIKPQEDADASEGEDASANA